MPETRTLTYQDDQLDVKLVIGKATALAGMKRALLSGRALAYLDELEAQDGDALGIAAQRLLARYLYPDLLAAVVEAEGLNPDMEVPDFLDLPEELTDAWQNAVYDLNPHWYPFRRPEEDAAGEEAEKKGAPPSSDYSASA